MTVDNPLFFIALIVVLIVIAALLPRWIRRSTSSAGSRADQRLRTERLEGILRELGTTVVIHAPEAAAREIVDLAALQDPRKFSVLEGGDYGIRFIDADDAVARFTDDPSGTRLQVMQFREYMGMPNTSAFWMEFRSRVTAVAGSRGVDVSSGIQVNHRRADDSATWTIER
jgi:hypothetical protein